MNGSPTDSVSERPLGGKVALVTGASRGIGAAAARALSGAGATVTLAARDASALDAVRASIDGPTYVMPTDVSDAAAVASLIAGVEETCGRLDIAVNAAAAHVRPPTLFGVSDVEDFDLTIAVSLRGAYLAMRHEIPALVRAGGGSIVNIASTAGLQGVGGLPGYVAAKHALIGLTKVAALDHAADGVRVNALAPGPIRTERLERAGEQARAHVASAVPAGRLGRPEEVADAAVWLSSDAAAYVNGAVLVLDGALLAGQRPFVAPRGPAT